MSREAMQQALDALELAGNSHGIMLLSDPPQDAWKTRRVNESISAAITALRAALAEQPAPVLTDAEIEKLAVKNEAFGFGVVDSRGFTTHGFSPEGLRNFARAILAAAIPPGCVVVPVEPTDEWVKAYLAANAAYWRETDELPAQPGKWRTGTTHKATKAGYRAAMIAARPGEEV